MEHLEDPSFVMNKISETLNSNGYFVFSTPYPYKKNWSDKTHINMHLPFNWINWGYRSKMKLVFHTPISPLPYFYRYSKFFSKVFSVRNPLPWGVSTEIFIFQKVS